ncbi:MAG: hypothetical protein M1832_002943 [Thelocarpon impressellum]|nr:MAG: hypothetical protein M1832_002943 [Thelocarpon impressellum]
MGANQSSSGADGARRGGGQRAGGEVKACYYELLGIERQATEEEIKKAYRRKALELHPDRNYGDVEKTTRLFAEVQAAYEVLSDPQERAWYDSHRDAILRDDDEATGEHYEHDVRVTTADDLMKIFTNFHGRADFSNSPNGFFTTLRETFDSLAREEDVACDWEGVQPVDYPSFGHADDSYEETVRPFYAVWSGFATKKPFSWKDMYRLAEAPDRRVRRMMEKENRRLREEGIREFNDAVRSLVAFVRKRDPRYMPNTQSEAERQEALRNAAAAQAARSRAANQAKLAEHVEPEWAKSREVEDEEVGEIGEEEEEVEEEHYECVACDKTFKSEKQFETHERSKKHIRTVQQLRRKMQKEERIMLGKTSRALDTDDEAEGTEEARQDEAEADVEELDEDSEAEAAQGLEEVQDAEDAKDASEASPQAPRSENHKSTTEHEIPNSTRPRNAASTPDVSSSDDEYAPREAVERRVQSDEAPDALLADQLSLTSLGASTDNVRPKRGKAAEKRARKAAQAKGADAEITCVACGETFPSKTKLFSHVKKLGHEQPLPALAAQQKKMAGKGKRG